MTEIWTSPELPALLAADIAGEPAPRAWRREFSPELTYGRHLGPPRGSARLAAVVLALSWEGAEWSLPLTVRSESLRRHGGQVSLPGGLVDAGESIPQAAERELGEELGPQPPLEWLGELAPIHVFASDAQVVPCVARISGSPRWRPQPAEVDRVLQLPLRELLLQTDCPPLQINRGPLQFAAPQLVCEGMAIWGATAVLLAELRGRLRRVAAQAPGDTPAGTPADTIA